MASIAGFNTFRMASPGAANADDAALVIITMANPAIAQRIPRLFQRDAVKVWACFL
jgi:hypothetical protein